MANQPSSHPFAASQRAQRVRTVLYVSIGILLAVGLLFLYGRSRRSALVISNPGSDYVVTLNGRAVNSQKTSEGLYIPVYSGLYRLRIDRPNYLPFISDVQIPPGKKVTVRPTFTLLPSGTESGKSGIAFVRPSFDQHYIYYLGDALQRLYRMDVTNQQHQALTDAPLTNIKDVEWSTRPDVVLVVMNDGTYLQDLVTYNFRNQSLEKVAGPEVLSPVWDPLSSERVAAAYFTASGEKSLVIADKRFLVIDRRADLSNFSNPKVSWSSDGRYLIVLNRDSDASKNNVWLYNLADATFNQITTSGNIIDANLSPNSTHLLYERNTDQGATELVARTLSNNQETVLPITSHLSQTAWKDDSSLYAPAKDTNELSLVTTAGASQQLSYFFPTSIAIKGMWYFPGNGSLIFYTDDAVYTVALGS